MTPIMSPATSAALEPILVTLCFLYTTFCISTFLRDRIQQPHQPTTLHQMDVSYDPSALEKALLQTEFATQFLDEVDRHLVVYATSQG